MGDTLTQLFAPKSQTITKPVAPGQQGPPQPYGYQQPDADRWLPLMAGLAGAFSSPMTPSQPLTPIGGFLSGTLQGRAMQDQQRQQAVNQMLAQEKLMLPYTTPKAMDPDTRALTQARTGAVGHVPEKDEWQRDQDERRTAALEERARKTGQGGRGGSTPEDKYQNKVAKANALVMKYFGDGQRNGTIASTTNVLDWMRSDPTGNAYLRHAARVNGVQPEDVIEAPPPEPEMPTGGPGSPANQAATAEARSAQTVEDVLATVPEGTQPTSQKTVALPGGRSIAAPQRQWSTPSMKGGRTPGKVPDSPRLKAAAVVADFKQRLARGGNASESELLASLTPIVGVATAQDLVKAFGNALY